MQGIIKELLSQEGRMCVSLLLPTHYKGFDEKNNIRVRLKNSLHEVEKELYKRCDKELAKKLYDAVFMRSASIDLNHPPAAIGIFVTTGFAKLVELPFEVRQVVVVGDAFELQDILYNLDRLMLYHVLVLSKKHIRLFKGVGNSLREILNNDFPRQFEDPYEEDKPAYHALYTKDPSQVQEKRVEAFIREVHHIANSYIKGDPIVLVGLDKHISWYKELDKHMRVLGEIHATHDKLPAHELIKLVWPFVEKHQKQSEEALIRQIESKISRQEAVCGIRSVLNKLDEIYDVHLVVERGLGMKGYIDKKSKALFAASNSSGYMELANRVEHMIEKVLKRKHGKVDIVSDHALKEYQGVVLMWSA